MRRKDREVTDLSEIIEIMKNCDVCRLALNDDGFPLYLQSFLSTHSLQSSAIREQLNSSRANGSQKLLKR